MNGANEELHEKEAKTGKYTAKKVVTKERACSPKLIEIPPKESQHQKIEK